MTESSPTLATLVTEPLGGSALARAAIAETAPRDWYPPRPGGISAWRDHARAVQASFADGAWLDRLRPAFAATGAAAARLERVVRERGVVVTTGQQPGLFGGPMLTWVKAISAIALADEIEAATGIPTAPVFWAATDDGDFEEARWTSVALPGGAVRLELDEAPPAGTPMAAAPLTDVQRQRLALERAAGSAVYRMPLEIVRDAYAPGQTIGGAFVLLLRRLLEPLGMAVVDASHPALQTASAPLLHSALSRSIDLSTALTRRTAEIAQAGFVPQVNEVPDLSLVFAYEQGRKRRVAHREAARAAGAVLGPTVLLRPVLERTLMPTVAYCAGPGEIAYFAQVSAVADALGAPRPLPVPRWSVTVIEPHVQRLLERLGIAREELQSRDQVATRLARASLPQPVVRQFEQLRASLAAAIAALEIDDTEHLVTSAALDGARRSLLFQLERLERRYVSAVKRRRTAVLHDIATAAGSVFPDGKRQERMLNFIPILARQGMPLVEAMRDEARRHARGLLGFEQGIVRERTADIRA